MTTKTSIITSKADKNDFKRYENSLFQTLLYYSSDRSLSIAKIIANFGWGIFNTKPSPLFNILSNLRLPPRTARLNHLWLENREEKCDVTLPWNQNFWITTRGSIRNDEDDGNEKEKSNRFTLAKQQLCTCLTLFWTFLSSHCTGASGTNCTCPPYGAGEEIFFFLDTVFPDWAPDNFSNIWQI